MNISLYYKRLDDKLWKVFTTTSNFLIELCYHLHKFGFNESWYVYKENELEKYAINDRLFSNECIQPYITFTFERRDGKQDVIINGNLTKKEYNYLIEKMNKIIQYENENKIDIRKKLPRTGDKEYIETFDKLLCDEELNKNRNK